VRVLAPLALAAAAIASVSYLFPSFIAIVAWPSSGPVRLALLAPLSRLWISSGAAVALITTGVAILRWSGVDNERLRAAAIRISLLLLWVVPYLPWLPDRAPLLLVLAGPLRWAVAAVAMGGAIAALFPWTNATAGYLHPRRQAASQRIARALVLLLSFGLFSTLGLRFNAAAGFSGDEPHYLVIAHSLLVDHDLDIANNHERRDYHAFFGGELRPDYLRRGQHGEIYSIHAPGLPAVLLPAYALGGATGAVVAMTIVSALAALAIFDLAALAGGAVSGAVAWAAVCLTVPFLPHAWLIYPEGAGAFIVAWSVLWIWQNRASNGRMIAHGALLALLPWLHTKFIVLAVLLAAWQCARLLTSDVSATIRSRLAGAAVFLAPLMVSTAVWLLFFDHLYGTLNPEAPYGNSTQLSVLAQNIPHGTLGLFFDQKFGLLAYSPVYLLAAAGMWLMLRDRQLRPLASGLLIVGAGYLLSTTRFYMWWGGSSAPARFLVPLLPLAAPAIAVAAGRLRSTVGRAATIGTFVASLAIAGVCLASDRAELLFSDPHGTALLLQALQGSAPVDISLPTFTEENWVRPLLVLLEWTVAAVAAAAIASTAARKRIVRSEFATASICVLMFGAIASPLVRASTREERDAVADRGRLSSLDAYDRASLRAVDPDRRRRLSDGEVSEALTVVRTSLSEAPIALPEGEYEARVWFDEAYPLGDVRVTVADRIVLASSAISPGGPSVVRFRVPVPVPISITFSDPSAARHASTLQIVPVELAAGAQHSGVRVTGVEPIDDRRGAFIAYVGTNSYAEGGVFWTKGTNTAQLFVVPAGAEHLRLILTVGPNPTRVQVECATQDFEVDMSANETREIPMTLTRGIDRVSILLRSSRAFRPAEVDRSSDDRRALGVRVRPRLE
jgi:hypothetical protein